MASSHQAEGTYENAKGKILQRGRNESGLDLENQISTSGRRGAFFLTSLFIERFDGFLSVTASRVENRRSGVVSRLAVDGAFAPSPQSGLAWLCFLFPLIEPDRRISRIRLSEKSLTIFTCNAVCDS